MRLAGDRVGHQPEIYFRLGGAEDGDRPLHADRFEEGLLASEAVGIAVIVQFREAFAGQQDGVFPDVGEDAFGDGLRFFNSGVVKLHAELKSILHDENVSLSASS